MMSIFIFVICHSCLLLVDNTGAICILIFLEMSLQIYRNSELDADSADDFDPDTFSVKRVK